MRQQPSWVCLRRIRMTKVCACVYVYTRGHVPTNLHCTRVSAALLIVMGGRNSSAFPNVSVPIRCSRLPFPRLPRLLYMYTDDPTSIGLIACEQTMTLFPIALLATFNIVPMPPEYVRRQPDVRWAHCVRAEHDSAPISLLTSILFPCSHPPPQHVRRRPDVHWAHCVRAGDDRRVLRVRAGRGGERDQPAGRPPQGARAPFQGSPAR